MSTFKSLRPAGHGVDSRIIKSALPTKLRMKVCRRTVIRRLAERGYNAAKKVRKTDTGPAHRAKRVAFAKSHEAKSADDWVTFLQAVGDLKEFTYYPQQLKPKHARLRASWTYMKDSEKLQPAFVRPKRWFTPKDGQNYQQVLRCVFNHRVIPPMNSVRSQSALHGPTVFNLYSSKDTRCFHAFRS